MAKIRKVDGKYMVDYRIDGVRRRVFLDSRDEARNLVKSIQGSGPLKQPVLETRRLLRDAIHDYVANVTSKKGPRAQKEEPAWFEPFYDFLWDQGIEFVDQIKVIHLTKLQTNMLKSVGPGTVNRRFGLFSHFFSVCLDWDFISEDPTMKLKMLEHSPERRRLWTDEQITEAIRLAPFQWAQDVFWFVAHTGARDIEVCRLTWTDVDFAKGSFVLRSYKGRSGKLRERSIPMTEEMKSFLTEIRLRQPLRIGPDTGFVFVNNRGVPLTSHRIAQVMRRVADKMGLKNHSLYGFRHSLFTGMAENNVSHEKIKQLAGHADIRTTQIYTSQLSTKSLLKTLDETARSRKIER